MGGEGGYKEPQTKPARQEWESPRQSKGMILIRMKKKDRICRCRAQQGKGRSESMTCRWLSMVNEFISEPSGSPRRHIKYPWIAFTDGLPAWFFLNMCYYLFFNKLDCNCNGTESGITCLYVPRALFTRANLFLSKPLVDWIRSHVM